MGEQPERPHEPKERISFLQPQAFPGMELLVAEGSAKPWHVFHERYAFCTCDFGLADWRYRSRAHQVENGCTMLLEPGEVHRTTLVHTPGDFKVLIVPFEVLMNAGKELGLLVTAHFRMAQTGDPRVFRAISGFFRAVESGASVLEQQSWFALCVKNLHEYAERRPAERSDAGSRIAVERAKACLQERFSEAVSLDELAVLTGLSRFHLVRAFTKRVGLPPHAYQNHVRIERGRAMLRAGVPPAEVAASVGFSDQSHFTKRFKQVYQTTPGEYAQAAC